MPTPVLTLIPSWPLIHDIEMHTHVADFGDGFEQRANFNLAYSRADGEGGVTSYVGRNKFTIHLNTMDFSGAAQTLWAFYKARKGSLEAFYIYNVPDERSTPDATGSDTAGRYLVRFQDANLSREKFTLKLYNSSLSMIEVRA